MSRESRELFEEVYRRLSEPNNNSNPGRGDDESEAEQLFADDLLAGLIFTRLRGGTVDMDALKEARSIHRKFGSRLGSSLIEEVYRGLGGRG